MINSISLNQFEQLKSPHGCPSPPRDDGCVQSDQDMDQDIATDTKQKLNVGGDETRSHSRTVQALRKYLQRKLSSEDSSSERECQSPQDTDVFHRSFDTTEEPKSTLTCSIVYPVPAKAPFPFLKQRSLDDYSHSVPLAQSLLVDNRYLRTDLCVPILLSRCTFCDQSFELEDDLRAHMRESHWNYFFDRNQDHSSSSEALDLSMKKSSDGTGSLPNLNMNSLSPGNIGVGFGFGNDSNGKGIKKQVKCATCGKGFSTKWNWKQHQKIHLRENLQAYPQ